MQVPPTLFERIISGELPCAKVYEDEHVFASWMPGS
jgi:diadenosine tetraphosphate (Ap4A) HIT family hydrolase